MYSDMRRDLSFVLNYALNRGFQIHPGAFEILKSVDADRLERLIKEIIREKTRDKMFQISRGDLETYLGIKEDHTIQGEAKVVMDPTREITTMGGVDGHNALFASRFTKLKRIITGRPEARSLKSLIAARGLVKPGGDPVFICGLVESKSTQRNYIRIVLEDHTGTMEIMVFDEDLQKIAQMLLPDQMVMVKIEVGKTTGYIAKTITLPDVGDYHVSRSESDAYAAFLSDLHIGSKYFMEEEFARFVSWISSADPIAKKIRFVLICGDVVDGIGIYPNQNKELVQQTIEEQLQRAVELLSGIPKNVRIIIMPGNHDPGRRALPQPAIPEKYCKQLWEKENITMVGNPAVVSLNGVKVLMFHGQSIDDIVKITPGLSYDKPIDVMKQFLMARHLSPIYGSQTPIAPEKEDHMVIEEPPDIFHVGHVHKAAIGSYRGILLINSGSWQKQTPFQASVGMVPNPGISFIINLKTFKVYHENYNLDLENIL